MPMRTKYEAAALRLRRARNAFLLSQVAALDLAKMSASDAARLDFEEVRAKRLAEWIGKPDLSIDQAMQIYTSILKLIEGASARRASAREDTQPGASEPVNNGETGSPPAPDSDHSTSTPNEATPQSEHDSEAEADQTAKEAAVRLSQDVDDALEAAGLPEYASFRAIRFVVKIQAEKSRSALMLESLLLSAVAQFDVFISRMILTSLRIDPSPLKESEKTYTYRDLTAHDSLDAFYSSAANAYADALMYKGMDSWMKFLSKATRTDMEWVTDLLAEVIMRRNVHVHAGGIASPQYLSELGKRAAAVKLGDELPVTAEYLEDALNRMARAAVVLSQAAVSAICVASKRDKTAEHSIDQDQGVVDASFDLLSAGRYAAVEHLAAQLDPLVATNSTRERLRANSFSARKFLYGPEEVAADLEAWDVTAAEDELVLAKYCLLDDVEHARFVYEKLLAADRISVMELATWPILEPLRVAIEAEQKAQDTGDESSNEDSPPETP